MHFQKEKGKKVLMLDSFSAGLCAAIAGTVLKIADDSVMLGKFVSNSQLDVVS